ncbi:MviM Predicted dehydrogenases and related proteins [Candidatus Nanopelagicaceae bacterium]
MIKVGIVGLGDVAFEYRNHTHSRLKITHADIIRENPFYELVCGIDSDQIQREKFSKFYDVPTFSNFDLNSPTTEVDLWVISTPTHTHLEILEKVLELQPQYILMEKPLSQNLVEANHSAKLVSQSETKFFLNYQRNYHPEIQKIAETMNEAKSIHLIGNFNGNWLNTGSHLIALAQHLVGDRLTLNYELEARNDALHVSGKEYSVDLFNQTNSAGNFFSLKAITPTNHIEYNSTFDTISYYSFQRSAIFSNEMVLTSPPNVVTLDEVQGIQHVYSAIQACAAGLPHPKVGIEQGLNTMVWLDKLKTKF